MTDGDSEWMGGDEVLTSVKVSFSAATVGDEEVSNGAVADQLQYEKKRRHPRNRLILA